MGRVNKFVDEKDDLLELYHSEQLVGEMAQSVYESSPMPEVNGLVNLDPDQLIPYHNEHLRLSLHSGEEREQLKDSIKKNGIINPIICKKYGDKYEILSGHNRVDICKELGLKVPCIVKDTLSPEEEDLIVIDTNLLNRQHSEYKPTQLGYILKVKFDAQKHQGNYLGTEYTKGNTGDKLGQEYGLSRKMISIYIKLNELIDIAKASVDEGQLQLKAAYQLAFLSKDIQMLIMNLKDEYTINEKTLFSLRNALVDKEFVNNDDMIAFVKSQLSEKVTNKRKFDYRNVKKYIPREVTENEIEDYIINAIKAYRGY